MIIGLICLATVVIITLFSFEKRFPIASVLSLISVFILSVTLGNVMFDGMSMEDSIRLENDNIHRLRVYYALRDSGVSIPVAGKILALYDDK